MFFSQFFSQFLLWLLVVSSTSSHVIHLMEIFVFTAAYVIPKIILFSRRYLPSSSELSQIPIIKAALSFVFFCSSGPTCRFYGCNRNISRWGLRIVDLIIILPRRLT
uniref:Uncharacterized protein n=1 Tax=Utricularia reniformis TaxID=192314 RepID=A0A1Y0B4A0_9LAMI|nr:hypothetical protein AEK19_MT2061 [Utricularia reniformis]ART32218.1 hypothetical protein AEK19_MT2061 [Utricularia reniformis]